MAAGEHQLTIEKRERLVIEGGVEHVHSYDGDRIVLRTSMGFLTLEGENINIEELNLEHGNLYATGNFTGAKYSEEKGLKGKGKGFFSRILK